MFQSERERPGSKWREVDFHSAPAYLHLLHLHFHLLHLHLRQVDGSTRTASRSSASTIRSGNGSELKSARLRWSAALKSGGLPGCSNKKSSDRHHGKPSSKTVKLILFISGSSRRRPRPRRGGCGLCGLPVLVLLLGVTRMLTAATAKFIL